MKTKYVNKSNKMKQIRFSDGTNVFLRRGDSHESSKTVDKMSEGIKTSEVRSSKRSTSSEETKTEE